tara:strand:+ start:44 stop:1990 length:1947 start_codon:yes stop_codon:yes gene_type:complete
MCGFVGYFNQKDNNDDDRLIKSMTNTLNHRGPDSSNIFINDQRDLFLGHTRLSIIDLNVTGDQPYISNSGRYACVYNGEIYNFKTLKHELSNQFPEILWKGSSDTEVLVNCLEYWGDEKTLDKIIGMFAFCLYDIKERTILLAKDKFGEKPLYYGLNNNKFYFASELKSLIKDPGFKKEIDKQSLNNFFSLNYIPAPKSIYKNIFKLMPGHYFKLKLNDSLNIDPSQQKKYWDIQALKSESITNSSSFEESKKDLKKLIDESVEEQLVSDVEIGAFLSSGIDSSLIVSTMSKISKKKVNTFTLGFDNNYFDESKKARKISNYLGTNHQEVIFDANKALEIIPRLNEIYCEPFSDSSQIPTFFLTQFAKKSVKVALTGDGGDELFGGYNRYIHSEQLMKFYKNKNNFFNKVMFKLNNIYNFQNLNSFFSKFEKFISPKYQINDFFTKLNKIDRAVRKSDKFNFYLALISHWNPDQLIKSSSNDFEYLKKSFVEYDNIVESFMLFDILHYLSDDLLVKIDRAAMSNSLETRCPYLKKEIADFSFKLPLNYKINENEGKLITKSILFDNIPKEIFDAKKRGFLIPLSDWLKNDLRDWADSLLNKQELDKHDLFSNSDILKEWNDFKDNKNIDYYKLWDVLIFQSWYNYQIK